MVWAVLTLRDVIYCHIGDSILSFCSLLFTSRFRLLCQSIIAHKLFDYVVLVFIFLNCITVALERPKILQGSVVRIHFTEYFQYSATTHRTLSILRAAISRLDQTTVPIGARSVHQYVIYVDDLWGWWCHDAAYPHIISGSLVLKALQKILVPQQAASHLKAKSKLVKCVCKWLMKEQFDYTGAPASVACGLGAGFWYWARSTSRKSFKHISRVHVTALQLFELRLCDLMVNNEPEQQISVQEDGENCCYALLSLF